MVDDENTGFVEEAGDDENEAADEEGGVLVTQKEEFWVVGTKGVVAPEVLVTAANPITH